MDAERFADSTTRMRVWDDIQALVDTVKSLRVRVPAIFLAGSFTTAKVDPGDGDMTLICDASRITNPATFGKVQAAVSGARSLGLELDAFVIMWPAWPSAGRVPEISGYLEDRGHWDDFWQRHVTAADRVPPQRHHSLPARGYLEVIFDGYR